LQSHGGNVELVSIDDGTVRLALHGSCHHCSSSTVTMQQTIEVAIHGKAPEVTSIEIDGIAESAPEASEGRVALPLLAT
jgi:Fe-S cluster biogenesis protein NfuA